MNPPRVDLILRQLDALPSLPPAVRRVPAKAGPPNVDAGMRLVSGERDRTLAVRVVAALTAAQPDYDIESQEACPAGLWRHSLAVACAAELLAERVARSTAKSTAFPPAPFAAFCCGLAHDLGKLALSAAAPKSYERIMRTAAALRGNIADVEREVLGLDHHAAGRRLAERWRLPQAMRDVTWLHNLPLPTLRALAPANQTLIALVSLADHLAREWQLGYSGNYSHDATPEELVDLVGIDARDLDFVQTHIDHLMRAWAAELGFRGHNNACRLRGASPRLPQTRAAARRRVASARRVGRPCDYSSIEWSGIPRPSAPNGGVAEVLGEIGRAAARLIDRRPLTVFALDMDASAHVVFIEEGGAATRAFAPASANTNPPSGGGASIALDTAQRGIREAGDEWEWIAREHAPRWSGSRRWWMPMQSAGETIGGLIWGGGAGEALRLIECREALAALCAEASAALREAQARDAAARFAEQLAHENRRLGDDQARAAGPRAVESLAELAAGAAHEMNNPLMVISGRSQLLSHRLSDERDRAAALAVHRSALRLSDMVTALMDFARPARPARQSTAIETLLAETVRLLTNAPRRDAQRIHWNVRQLPSVLVDPSQTARALAALLENALQATATAAIGQVRVEASLHAGGERVIISIVDAGEGMDGATLQHAFDPFFSKMSAGRRRGMGLAMARRLIEANGGTLRLDSRPGRGTHAVVTLPLAPPRAATATWLRRQSA